MKSPHVQMMVATGACVLALTMLVACAAPNQPAQTPSGMMGGGQSDGGAGPIALVITLRSTELPI